MKRCPQCNHVETDEALKFCRVDGAMLINDSSSFGSEADTAQLGSSPNAGEVHTSILVDNTNVNVNRGTAPTTVLPLQSAQASTRELRRVRSRLTIRLAIAGVIVVLLGVGTYFYTSRKGRSTIDSIAVLPFQNASGDPNAEYLADGISEALINSLADLPQLRVVARSTAFRYKGKDVDPQQVGRELNVRSVLMGRVRQIGETLVVQVDLVDATTGAQLWGQEYERKVSDVISVKQAIARETTEKLSLRLSGEDRQRLVRRDTNSPEAYQFYLQGRFYWNKRTAEGIKKAIEEFHQAADKDPNYALAYVGLADCYILLEEIAGIPASESLQKARAAADRALQLDDSSAEAHTSSAMIYQHLWSWSEAESEYRRAISLNPNYPTAHQWYSNYLFATGRLDDSLREGKRAQELDPLAPIISHNVAYVYLLKNDLESAITESKRILEISPSFPPSINDLGWAYLKQGRYDDATAEFQKAVQASGRQSGSLGNLGYCYALTGKRTEALGILKELKERYTNGEAVAVFMAGLYAGLGDSDRAFALLEKDFQKHSGQIPTIASWLSLERLRSDPRYADLVQRMGLKQ